MYGAAESWARMAAQGAQLETVHNACLRQAMGLQHGPHSPSTAELLATTGHPSMADLLRLHRARWQGPAADLLRLHRARWQGPAADLLRLHRARWQGPAADLLRLHRARWQGPAADLLRLHRARWQGPAAAREPIDASCYLHTPSRASRGPWGAPTSRGWTPPCRCRAWQAAATRYNTSSSRPGKPGCGSGCLEGGGQPVLSCL